MKFIENGPDIPQRLLNARDEGRLAIFCGSGVSRARAGLPNFYDLTKQVIKNLKLEPEHEASRVLQAVEQVEEKSGVTGFFSPDMIFSLLEKEFPRSVIEKAVAEALNPGSDADQSAHAIIATLSKTSTGSSRLITTNFDRLFDNCIDGFTGSSFTSLPDPETDEDWGCVHLHGRVNADYSGANKEGFVLSSGSFGAAYMAKGWAREFVIKVIRSNAALFIGYSADDPPLRYLLEGMKHLGQEPELYALQEGGDPSAIGRWEDKGVTAIPFATPENSYHLLWESLGAWSEYARDPGAWYDTLLGSFQRPPDSYSAFQRTQFVDAVSTKLGASALARTDPPPPAEWLCVLDPSIRLQASSSEIVDYETGAEERYDFISRYGLEGEMEPSEDDNDDTALPHSPLMATDEEWQSKSDTSFQSLSGQHSDKVVLLNDRLSNVTVWVRKVACQPAALWWASRQKALHPQIRADVEWQFRRREDSTHTCIRKGWKLLFHAHDTQNHGRMDVYDLKGDIRKDGWTTVNFERYLDIHKPVISVEKFHLSKLPPSVDEISKRRRFPPVEIDYHEHRLREIKIPDEEVARVAQAHRQRIIQAYEFDCEDGGLYIFRSILREPEKPGETRNMDYYGFQGYIFLLVELFERLVVIDPKAAKAEFEAWPRNHPVFDRLIIWACKFEKIVTKTTFVREFLRLESKSLWDSKSQRDFLLVLASRWPKLTLRQKKRVEDRYLEGPPRLKRHSHQEHQQRRASRVLTQLLWLVRNGGELSRSSESLREELLPLVDDWNENWIDSAADSMDMRGGSVSTDKNYSQLLDIPTSEIAAAALNLEGSRQEFLVEERPFQGLAEEKPLLALRSLYASELASDHITKLWRTLLHAHTHTQISPRFVAVIANRLTQLSKATFSELADTIAYWFEHRGGTLWAVSKDLFQRLWNQLILYVETETDPEEDRITTYLTELQINLMHRYWSEESQDFMQVWKDNSEVLLMNECARPACLRVLFTRFNNLFIWNKEWTSAQLLPILTRGSTDLETRNAWKSFLKWHAVPPFDIYDSLKPFVLKWIDSKDILFDEMETRLAVVILSGWISKHEDGTRYVSAGEFHSLLLKSSNGFRKAVIDHYRRYTKKRADEFSDTGDLVLFLQEVWPQRNAFRTQELSSSLCNLAFSRTDDFNEIASLIAPLLVKTDRREIGLYQINDDDTAFLADIASAALRLLDAVLSDDPRSWPWSIRDFLDSLAEHVPNIDNNLIFTRLRTLQRG